MRMLAALLFAATAVNAKTLWTDLRDNLGYNYDDWKNEFGAVAPKHSESTFNANLAEIRAHNAKPHGTWKMGVNKFTGMSKQEFKQQVARGYKKGLSAQRQSVHSHHHLRKEEDLTKHKPVSDLPASMDWRSKNVVSAVKDQGMCGGCWSFSTAETIESHVAIQTGTLLTLSEQEILACTQNPQKCGGSGGCEGATQELGFGFVASSKGLALESNWPYTGADSTCDWTGHTAAAGITGYVALPFNNYTALVNAASTMPIAISAAASAWQLYESGVLGSDSNCGTDVDHAIQLVGWGTDSTAGDYWLVRNSWGPSWGESGYIRVARFGEGKEPCATDSTPLDGDGCAGGPSSIQVCGLCGILSDSSYPTGGHLVTKTKH